MSKISLYNDYRQDLEEIYGMTLEQFNEEYETDYTEDNCYQIVEDFHESTHRDIFNNLPYTTDYSGDFIAIADLGLWQGRRVGYKDLNSLRDIFYTANDYSHWYVERNNLKYEGSHHDGNNYIIYREWKEDLTEEQRDNYRNHLYNGTATKAMMYYYTKSIGHYFTD